MVKRKAKAATQDDQNPTGAAPDAAAGQSEIAAVSPTIAPLAEIQPASEPEADLVGLLRALDDHGVSLVEADWRRMTDAEQAIAARWVKGRRTGVMSPVPDCVWPWATDALKAESTPYAAEQQAARRTLMPVTFGTPSLVPQDDGDMVRLSLKIPADSLSYESAGRLFVWTRLVVEISRRAINEWDQADLPTMSDGDRRIIRFETESATCHLAKQFKTVRLLVSTDTLGPAEALSLAKAQGSLRVEVIGTPKTKDDEPEDTDDHGEHAEAQKAANKRTLLDRDPATATPREPILIHETGGLYLIVKTIQTDDDRWRTTFESVTPDGLETQDNDVVIEASVSESEAVQARLGYTIARWDAMEFDAAEWGAEHAAMMDGMRDWLNLLAAGKSIDDVEADMVDRLEEGP